MLIASYLRDEHPKAQLVSEESSGLTTAAA